MESFRNPLLQQLDQCRDDLLRLVPLDEMEVRTRVSSAHVWHLAPANAVRVDDNSAVRRLPEDFSETHNWYDVAFYQVMEHRSRPNGRKLVDIADKNESGAVGNRPQKGIHQRHIHHRGFIDDQKTASKWI